MEVLAFFFLVIALIVLAVGAVLVLGLARRLRSKKLDPERDKLEQPDAGEPHGRPQHVRAEGEQQTRFVTHR